MTTYQKIAVVSGAFACLTLVMLVNPPFRQHNNYQHRVEKIAQYIHEENDEISIERARSIAETVLKSSKTHNVDYRLILAMMKVESNFRARAVSPMGARGIMQVKPSLARYIADDAGVEWKGNATLDDPHTNVRIGVYFLSELLEDFKTAPLALFAYNIGPTRLKELLSDDENLTSAFVRQVFGEYRTLSQLFPENNNLLREVN